MADIISVIFYIIMFAIALPTIIMPLLAFIGCLIAGITYQIGKKTGIFKEDYTDG